MPTTPSKRGRSSRAAMVAVGLLVVLYGIVGFPAAEELTTNPEAAFNFDMSAAAADTPHPAFLHQHPHGCFYDCIQPWQQDDDDDNNDDGVDEPTSTDEGVPDNGCGVNQVSDGNGGCEYNYQDPETASCPAGMFYDEPSMLCAGSTTDCDLEENPQGCDADADDDRGRACNDARQADLGNGCETVHDPDSDRSRHCPAGRFRTVPAATPTILAMSL